MSEHPDRAQRVALEEHEPAHDRASVDYDFVVPDHLRAGTDKVVAYLDGGRGHPRDDGVRSGSARDDQHW
jgi:hypothetical protein